MDKPTFPQRAAEIQRIASELAQNKLTVADARISIHKALEGSDINSSTAANIVLPNYLEMSENDFALLGRLADAIDEHRGGSFDPALIELSQVRAHLGY